MNFSILSLIVSIASTANSMAVQFPLAVPTPLPLDLQTTEIHFDPLYSLTIQVGKMRWIGQGHQGTRYFLPFVGGKVSGPKFNGEQPLQPPYAYQDIYELDADYSILPIGTLVPGGGDWGLKDPDYESVLYPDLRETLRTDDGALIQVYETGVKKNSADATLLHMTFETGSEDYYWMNQVVGLGVLSQTREGGLRIDAFDITLATKDKQMML